MSRMIGIDLIGADENGLIDAGAQGIKAIVNYAKAPATVAPATPPTPANAPPKPPNTDGKHDSGESFLSKTIIAPIKVWHAIIASVGAAGGVWLMTRKK